MAEYIEMIGLHNIVYWCNYKTVLNIANDLCSDDGKVIDV